MGAIDLKEFLKHYIKEKKGDVIVMPSESEVHKTEVIGYHHGAVFHTLGERHGFTITKKSPNDSPYYIVSKDVNKNILTVSQNKNYFTTVYRSNLKNIKLGNTNWNSEIPKPEKKYTAQIRYHGEFLPCQITIFPKNEAEVIFDKPILVASGQSIVVYDKDVCLGGGVVS